MIFSVRFLLFCWAWSKLSQAMVTIGSLISHDIISFKVTPGSLNGQGTIWQGLSYLLKKDFSVFQTKIKDKVILTAFDSRLPKMTLKVHSQVWENFLAIESSLKMMKNAFYFTSKTLFVLNTFKFLSWFFGQVAKGFD